MTRIKRKHKVLQSADAEGPNYRRSHWAPHGSHRRLVSQGSAQLSQTCRSRKKATPKKRTDSQRYRPAITARTPSIGLRTRGSQIPPLSQPLSVGALQFALPTEDDKELLKRTTLATRRVNTGRPPIVKEAYSSDDSVEGDGVMVRVDSMFTNRTFSNQTDMTEGCERNESCPFDEYDFDELNDFMELGKQMSVTPSRDMMDMYESCQEELDKMENQEAEEVNAKEKGIKKRRRDEDLNGGLRSRIVQNVKRAEHRLIDGIISSSSRLDVVGSVARFCFGYRHFAPPSEDNEPDLYIQNLKMRFDSQARFVSIIRGEDFTDC